LCCPPVLPQTNCPGFGQDRVNFHQNPGRGTAGWADPTPTWPNRAGYSIPCAITLGSGGGGGGNSLTAWERGRRSSPGEQLSGSCGSCCVFSFSVSLLLLFPLFAVLLNCPYPDPPVSASFFPFSSAPRRGEGWVRGAVVGGCSQNQNTNRLHPPVQRHKRTVPQLGEALVQAAHWDHQKEVSSIKPWMLEAFPGLVPEMAG